MQNNTLTIGEAITRFGVQVDEHLSREAPSVRPSPASGSRWMST